eukprot:2905801-Rhodomonas_salina.1
MRWWTSSTRLSATRAVQQAKYAGVAGRRGPAASKPRYKSTQKPARLRYKRVREKQLSGPNQGLLNCGRRS